MSSAKQVWVICLEDDVDVALVSSLVARHGTKYTELDHAENLRRACF